MTGKRKGRSSPAVASMLLVLACSESPRRIAGGIGVELDGSVRDEADAGRDPIPNPEPPSVVVAQVQYAPSGPPAGRGDRIRVRLIFNESIVSSDLFLVGRSESGANISFDTAEAESTTAEFTVQIDPAVHESGTYRGFVDLEDLGGARTEDASHPDLVFQVDVDAGLSVDQSQVSFVRAVAGNTRSELLRSSDGAPGFTIPAGPSRSTLAPADELNGTDALPSETFRLEGGDAPREIRVYADAERGRRIGRVRPRDDGAWPRSELALETHDGATVWVTGIDASGNETAPVPIENAWYVAGSGTGLSNAPSPHRLFRNFRADSAVGDRDPVETQRTAADAPDGDTLQVEASRAWRAASVQLPALNKMAMAADPSSGRIHAFAGRTRGGQPRNGMWVWEGNGWRQVQQSQPWPAARFGHDMVWDEDRGVLVMFGGTDNQQFFDDTWEWDGSGWTRVEPEGPNPWARSGHGMAYVPARRRTVLIGGNNGAISGMDVWEWDGSSWIEVTPAQGSEPSARVDFAVARSVKPGAVVLFGGVSMGGATRQLWEWNGARWRDLTPRQDPGRAPEARTLHAMAYDARRNLVWMTGGRSATLSLIPLDPWTWDGSSWSRVTDPDTVEASRFDHCMEFDSSRDRLVLIGGLGTSAPVGDSWIFHPTSGVWRGRSPANTPSPRADPLFTWDPSTSTILAHGGDGQSQLFDLWSWNGARWQRLRPETAANPSRLYAAAADTQRNRWFAVGPGGTWSVSNGVFAELGPAPSVTQLAEIPLDLSSMVYDSARDRMVWVVNDGSNDSTALDVWEWDGVAWERRTPAGPGPSNRIGWGMAYDPGRRRTVLFGGSRRFPVAGLVDDTWEWDGSRWREVSPSSQNPGGRWQHRMVWDSDCACVVLHGGQGSGGRRNDVWEWDGQRWRERPTRGEPPAVTRAGLAYDPQRSTLVRFAGRRPNTTVADLWELEPPAKPAFELSVRLPEGIARDRVRRVVARAHCGGSGAGPTGAALRVARGAPMGANCPQRQHAGVRAGGG